MALALFQDCHNNTGANLSMTTEAGALLVAWVTGYQDHAHDMGISGGGTWVALAEYQNNWSIGRMFYCLSATGGASTFVLANAPDYPYWCIKEFRGASAWALGKTAAHVAVEAEPTGTVFSSGNVTPDAHASELLVGGYANEGHAATWAAGWTNRVYDGSGTNFEMVDQVVTPPSGAYAASGTFAAYNNYYIAQIATFYDSSTGGGETGGNTFKPIIILV